MGVLYTASQTATANTTAADSVSVKAGTVRSFLVREFTVAGGGTASAPNEVVLQRTTAGTVATAMIGLNQNAPTSATSFGLAQGTTVTATTVMKRFGVNANGALFRWVGPPGACLETPGAGQIGFRGTVGTSPLSTDVVIEEF